MSRLKRLWQPSEDRSRLEMARPTPTCGWSSRCTTRRQPFETSSWCCADSSPNVVAVDDGSADSSVAEALAAGARLVRLVGLS